MTRPDKSRITIIGAGLSGCFLAILLAKRHYNVTIYERLSKKEILNPTDRNINLTFHNYAVDALKSAGVWEAVLSSTLKLRGSITKLSHNKPILSTFDHSKLDYFTVSRQKLLEALLEKALRQRNIKLVLNAALVNVNRNSRIITILNTKTKKFKTITTDILIGAEGINSQVRAYIQPGQKAQYSQDYLDWGYRQISLSRTTAERLNFQKDFMYAWTGKNAIFTAFPNNDGTFSAMLSFSNSYNQLLNTSSSIGKFISSVFPELTPALFDMTESIMRNPNGNFAIMKTSPWSWRNFMVIVGDSAHTVAPFIGQGMTAAFGDCLALVNLIDKHNGNWVKIFSLYEKMRKGTTDVLVDVSIKSFEIFRRENRADYTFIFNKLESVLHNRFPKVFKASLFERIAQSPDDAERIYYEQLKQRKYMSILGVHILVFALTIVVAFIEKSGKFIYHFLHLWKTWKLKVKLVKPSLPQI